MVKNFTELKTVITKTNSVPNKRKPKNADSPKDFLR